LNEEEKDREARPTSSSQGSGTDAHKVEAERQGDTTIHLEWRDWVALTIASLETILLPAVAIIAILIILVILFGHF
jgi:hypothetical protein